MATSTRDINISVGSDDITDGTQIQRVVCYAKDSSSNLHVLDSDVNGHLKITQQDREIQRATTDITTEFDGTALSGSISDGKKTASWDCQNYDKFQVIMDGTTGFNGSLLIEACSTNLDGDFNVVSEIYEMTYGSDASYTFTPESAFQRYFRLRNSSGSTITFNNIKVYFLK